MSRHGESLVWFIGLFGVGMVVVGFQFFGQFWGEDAPVKRALGPKGIPVMAKVIARSESYPRITTVQYSVGSKPYETMVLQAAVVTGTPIGQVIAFRADPQDPRVIVRADLPKPWSWFKLAGCLLSLVLGVLLCLLVAAYLFNR